MTTPVSKVLRDATSAVWEMENEVTFLKGKVASLEEMNEQLQAALATKNSIKPDMRVIAPKEITSGQS